MFNFFKIWIIKRKLRKNVKILKNAYLKWKGYQISEDEYNKIYYPTLEKDWVLIKELIRAGGFLEYFGSSRENGFRPVGR